MRRWALAGWLLVTIAPGAFSGAFLVNRTTYEDGRVVQSTTSVGDRSIRVDVLGEKDIQSVIYRGDRKIFWVLDGKKRTYTELTQDQMEKTLARMDALLKAMPASTRHAFGERMGTALEKPAYVKKSSRIKVGPWLATYYQSEGEACVRKLWTVPKKSLHLTSSDLSAMKVFSRFFERFGRNRSDFFKFDRTDLGFAGVPVKTEVIEGGKVRSVSELREASEKVFPPETFEVPRGYKKKDVKGL